MNESPGAVDRLAFTLPDFTRHSWVGDKARSTWQPRLERIRRAWTDIEWLSIVDEVRPCALVGLQPEVLSTTIPRWTAHRLSAKGLPLSLPASHPGVVFAVVGSRANVACAHDAWMARADEVLGRLLGYPACCRAFFQRVWIEQQATDTTWAMATNTATSTNRVVTLESGEPSLANILWRWLGIRAVPHLPCRFDCSHSSQFGEQLLEVAMRAGFTDEVAWIREILSWPIEWSALHGIAEVKTPILKISTRTDATADKYVVRWTGTNYPREGATGLRFPYQMPRRPLMTEGRAFQLGLKRPAEKPPRPDWYHLDNGFPSPEMMSELHGPIVALARQQLRNRSGGVLDLGCGNGALLTKICEGHDGLIPHGVDKNRAALGRARVLLPQFAGNFTEADLFDCDNWCNGPRYALTLLMAGRLLEVERPIAERLLKRLEASSEAALLYLYPDSESRSLASVAREMGLLLHDPTAQTVSLLASAEFPEADAIDWSRLAEPQADHYDTEVILRLVSTTVTADRPQPYRRTPVGEFPSLFDGQVAIRPVYRSLPEFESLSAEYIDAPLDHPNLRVAAELVRRWPLAFAQCQRLLEAIHPALDARIPFESREIYRGSSCHSYESLFGTLWATAFCPIGLAEAIVHELAHQKLRALGVSFESATAIVGNHPSRLYTSPVVKDRERPMTAVLHAQYSYVHVVALDLHLLEVETDPARREALASVLERNLSRIEEGRDTIRRYFEFGGHGREFMEGFSRWTDTTIEAGRLLLGRAHQPAVAAQPLPDIDTNTNVIMTPDREVEVLSTFTSPRIVLLGNVLSDEECRALIDYCEPRLEPSRAVADADGNVRLHENRTSHDAMLRRSETAVIARIEARLAALARWPLECGEGLQVVRYEATQEYRAHSDWIDPDLPGLRKHLDKGGQRLATFVLYLNDVESGGETWFPEIGLRVMPKKGSALFFVNTDSRYVPDRLTLHAGSPVIKGVKLVANKWLRERPWT